MDPVSAVGLVSSVKDVVALGSKLRGSIAKTKWNRKRLLRLSDDVIKDLYAMQAIYEERKNILDELPFSRLALATDKLRSEMWRVCNKCQTMLSNEGYRQGPLKAIGSSFRAWSSRDSIEQDILDLRNIIRDCQRQFTTFAVARIESTVLLQGTEHSLMLRKLEPAVNQMLTNSDYGYLIRRRVEAEILASPDNHSESVERQYFSLQASRIPELVSSMLALKADILGVSEHPPLDVPFEIVFRSSRSQSSLEVLIGEIIQFSGCLQSRDRISPADAAYRLRKIRRGMAGHNSLLREKAAIGLATVVSYRITARSNSLALIYYAFYLARLSGDQRHLDLFDTAISTSKEALAVITSAELIFPERANEFRTTTAASKKSLALSLEQAGRKDEALNAMQEAKLVLTSAVNDILDAIDCQKPDSDPGPAVDSGLSESELVTVEIFYDIIIELARMSEDNAPQDAFTLTKEAFCLTERLESYDIPEHRIQYLYWRAMSSLTKSYTTREELSRGLTEDAVALFQRLSRAHPHHFSLYFLRVLYAYFYLRQLTSEAPSNGITISETQTQIFRSILYDGATVDMGLHRALLYLPYGNLRLTKDDVTPLGSTDEVVHDVLYAACATAKDRLESMNPQISEGITSFIGEIIRAFPEEASKSIETFKGEESNLSILPSESVIVSSSFLPISFLRNLIEFLEDAQETEEEYDSDDSDSYDNDRAPLYIQAALYSRTLEVLQEGSEQDLDLLVVVQSELGMFEDAKSTYQAALNTMEKYLATLNFTNALNRQRKYRDALEVVKNNHNFLMTELEDPYYYDSLQQLCRAIAYLGERKLECAKVTCETTVSRLRGSIVRTWSVEDHFALAYTLAILARTFMATESLESAFLCAEESTSFYRMYDLSDEWIYWAGRSDRAYTYDTYALTLTLLGEHDRALAIAKSATALYEEVVQDSPSCGVDYASALETLAKVHWSLDQHSEALAIQKDATRRWIELASHSAHLAKYTAESLSALAKYLDADGKAEEASKAREDSAEWKSKYVEESCDPLDDSYWEMFPEDRPECNNRQPDHETEVLEISSEDEPQVSVDESLEDVQETPRLENKAVLPALQEQASCSSTSSHVATPEETVDGASDTQKPSDVKLDQPAHARVVSPSRDIVNESPGIEDTFDDNSDQPVQVMEATGSSSSRSILDSAVTAVGWIDKVMESLI